MNKVKLLNVFYKTWVLNFIIISLGAFFGMFLTSGGLPKFSMLFPYLIIPLFLASVLVTILSFSKVKDETSNDTIKVRSLVHDDLWNQFLSLSQSEGYLPHIQMGQTFFFVRKNLFYSSQLMLIIESDGTATISFPLSLKNRIKRDFGVYRLASNVDQSHLSQFDETSA